MKLFHVDELQCPRLTGVNETEFLQSCNQNRFKTQFLHLMWIRAVSQISNQICVTCLLHHSVQNNSNH